MTYRKNDARLSTLADGAAVTNSNAPFPDNLSTVTISNGGSVVMETTPPTYICAAPDTGVARLEWAINSTHASVTVMFDFTGISSLPDNRILTLFSTGQNAGAGINLVSGALRYMDFAGVSKVLTTQTVYGKRVRVYLGQEIGTGTTDGELHFKAFFGADADSTTQGAASTGALYDSAGGNAGTVNFTIIRAGKLGSGGADSIPIEYIHSDDTLYTALGPLAVAVAAPVLTYTRQTVVELDSAATNSGVVTLTTDSGSPATPASISGPDGSGIFRVVLPEPMTASINMTMTATNGGGTDTEAIVITPSGSVIYERDFLTYDGSAWV